MIEVTLSCEDVNSKLAEGVTVADVDVEDCVGNSLLQILKLRLGHKVNFFSDSGQVWPRFGLKLEFGQYFAADVWLRLRS